jgi:hypothetical protein
MQRRKDSVAGTRRGLSKVTTTTTTTTTMATIMIICIYKSNRESSECTG